MLFSQDAAGYTKGSGLSPAIRREAKDNITQAQPLMIRSMPINRSKIAVIITRGVNTGKVSGSFVMPSGIRQGCKMAANRHKIPRAIKLTPKIMAVLNL